MNTYLSNRTNIGRIVTFLVLTFGLSTIFYVKIITGGEGIEPWLLPLMWCPGLSAILTKLIFDRNLRGLGWKPGPAKWLELAYLLPLHYRFKPHRARVRVDPYKHKHRQQFGGKRMNNEQIVIQTEGLSKRYKDVSALQGLNLQVAQHSIFGFLGPNGAGKSTAIKLLLGLIRPTAGRAAIFGLDSVQDSVAIRQRVGYLAQDPRYYQHMTARETMRFAARFFYKGPKEAIEARIEETLALVRLEDKTDRPIKGFSGGERQRLGIAQAQVNYPDLLILDEPAAALDPMGRRDVLEVMARLRKHTTIFYSTHILDDVQRVSDNVAILNHGQLVAQAPIEQLLAGSSGAAYTLTVRGDGQAAQQTLKGQSWITAVATHPNHSDTTLQISVTDEDMAETELLRLVLADKETAVTEFGRKKFNLEEIFLQMVDGGN